MLKTGQTGVTKNKPKETINQFYKIHCEPIELSFKRDKEEEHFKKACELFSVDPKEFQELKTDNARITMVKKQYFNLASQYHPDKHPPALNEVATKIMSVLNQCHELLDKVARDEKLLALSIEKFEQKSCDSIPQYQLEKFVQDPYYYIDMAGRTDSVCLIQNFSDEKPKDDLTIDGLPNANNFSQALNDTDVNRTNDDASENEQALIEKNTDQALVAEPRKNLHRIRSTSEV